MAENTNAVGVTPRTVEAQDSVTRPSDTTAYAAGDAISDNATTATAAGYFALDFKGRPGGGLMLTDFTLHKSDQDQTNADIWVHLFTTAPAFAGFEDNATLAITDAEWKEHKGSVKFDADDWANVGNGDTQTVSKTIGIVPASDSSTIYGIMSAGAAYTPGSGEIFTLTAKGVQD